MNYLLAVIFYAGFAIFCSALIGGICIAIIRGRRTCKKQVALVMRVGRLGGFIMIGVIAVRLIGSLIQAVFIN
ncbi:MAG: hypothetical protein AAGI54_12585 [Planctomycetota bacterium]